MKNQKVYVADFETCNSQDNILTEKTSVWLWDVCNINTLSHKTGHTIVEFINYIEKLAPAVIYTHNLKFDGLFIMDYIMKNGFEHTKEKSLKANQFTTLITSANVFYSMKICFEAKNKKTKKTIEFRDSSKKIKGTVEQIAINYNLPILKGKIDYTMPRDENYQATENEIAYVHNDTEIVARVLQMQYAKKLTHLTSASDTFHLYKEFCGKHFNYLYPTLSIETDEFIRKSYRGGINLIADKYKSKLLENVYIYDVNSMYPSVMAYDLLPYGIPKYFTGKYIDNKAYPLYIQRVKVCCRLKNEHLPTILMPNLWFLDEEYLVDTAGEMLELNLTNLDLDLLFEHYEIFDIKYIDGYMFMGSHKLFKEFIMPLYELKSTSTGADKEHYKTLLNGLYGKFASNPKHKRKIPFLKDGVVCFMNTEMQESDPIYTAVSSFITAYARVHLFKAIYDNFDGFIYCDTDSIHLTHEARNIDIDDKKLGAWKNETKDDPIIKACYLAPKTYMYLTKSYVENKKIAGCPANVKEKITFDNFKYNQSFTGKLLPKRVNGGVVLVENVFTIKMR